LQVVCARYVVQTLVLLAVLISGRRGARLRILGRVRAPNGA
jgi:hypothetical protein